MHPCERPCHLNACAVCTVNIKFSCHCGLTPVYYKCADYYKYDTDIDNMEALQIERGKLRSCGNRCIRNVRIDNLLLSS